MQTYATVKGQVVIPAKLRRKYGIKAGTRIEVVDDGSRIVLQPITREFIHGLRGVMRGSGALRILEEERRRERGTPSPLRSAAPEQILTELQRMRSKSESFRNAASLRRFKKAAFGAPIYNPLTK